MPVMSGLESAFCRSAPWRWFARRVVLPWALRGVSLHGEVLEIGGGSGAMAAGGASSFPRIQLTMIDLDADMVRAARSALSGHSNVTVGAADVTALPFDDCSFDTVTSYLMLHHVIAWEDALREVARVLRPGGAFIGYDLTRTRLARGIHTADRSPHHIIAPEELTVGLRNAGFLEVDVRPTLAGHLMRFRAATPDDPA